MERSDVLRTKRDVVGAQEHADATKQTCPNANEPLRGSFHATISGVNCRKNINRTQNAEYSNERLERQ